RLQALLDAGDELLRHRAAYHLVLEHEAGRGLARLDRDLHPRELTGPSGLLLVGVVDRNRLGDLFAIGDLRRADVGVDLVAAPENVDLDIEMQLAHSLEDRLAALLVGRNAERGILGRELRQRDAEL